MGLIWLVHTKTRSSIVSRNADWQYSFYYIIHRVERNLFTKLRSSHCNLTSLTYSCCHPGVQCVQSVGLQVRRVTSLTLLWLCRRERSIIWVSFCLSGLLLLLLAASLLASRAAVSLMTTVRPAGCLIHTALWVFSLTSASFLPPLPLFSLQAPSPHLPPVSVSQLPPSLSLCLAYFPIIN